MCASVKLGVEWFGKDFIFIRRSFVVIGIVQRGEVLNGMVRQGFFIFHILGADGPFWQGQSMVMYGDYLVLRCEEAVRRRLVD